VQTAAMGQILRSTERILVLTDFHYSHIFSNHEEWQWSTVSHRQGLRPGGTRQWDNELRLWTISGQHYSTRLQVCEERRRKPQRIE